MQAKLARTPVLYSNVTVHLLLIIGMYGLFVTATMRAAWFRMTTQHNRSLNDQQRKLLAAALSALTTQTHRHMKPHVLEPLAVRQFTCSALPSVQALWHARVAATLLNPHSSTHKATRARTACGAPAYLLGTAFRTGALACSSCSHIT